MNETKSSTLSIRVDASTKKRLERLSKNTERSPSFHAAAAIKQYLGINEWQVAGIRAAIDSVDNDGVIAHDEILTWVSALDSNAELPIPAPTKS
jgi:predicted transcriptional regulator